MNEEEGLLSLLAVEVEVAPEVVHLAVGEGGQGVVVVVFGEGREGIEVLLGEWVFGGLEDELVVVA